MWLACACACAKAGVDLTHVCDSESEVNTCLPSLTAQQPPQPRLEDPCNMKRARGKAARLHCFAHLFQAISSRREVHDSNFSLSSTRTIPKAIHGDTVVFEDCDWGC